MFGDREILDGKDVIRVYLSLRADDASTVPVAVKAQIDQTPERYITTIYLLVERNPSPAAGVFHFTPDSGRAQVETRLRFEDYSHVRAIAETNDGKLWMDSRWVKAAGGCSAPGGKYRVPAALLGKMKFRFEDEHQVQRAHPRADQHPPSQRVGAGRRFRPDRGAAVRAQRAWSPTRASR